MMMQKMINIIDNFHKEINVKNDVNSSPQIILQLRLFKIFKQTRTEQNW